MFEFFSPDVCQCFGSQAAHDRIGTALEYDPCPIHPGTLERFGTACALCAGKTHRQDKVGGHSADSFQGSSPLVVLF